MYSKCVFTIIAGFLIFGQGYSQNLQVVDKDQTLDQTSKLLTDSIKAARIYEKANMYFSKADYDSAFIAFEEAIVLYKALNDWEKQVDIYLDLSGIAWKYRDMENATLFNDSALRLLKTSKTDSLHTLYAKAYHNYGTIELLKGNLQGAIVQLEHAIRINEQTKENSAKRLLNNYNNIGVAYSYMNSSTMAIRYAQKSLDLVLKTEPENGISKGRAYQNLGVAYVKDFNYKKAEEYYIKALKCYKEVLKEPHINFAQLYKNLAVIAMNDSAFQKAIDYNTQSMYNYGGDTDRPHPESFRLYHNNATIYKMMGKYDKAIELERKSISLFEGQYGPKHPEIANDYLYLGRIYHAKGDYDASLLYLQKAIIANIAQFNDSSLTAMPKLEGIFSNFYLGITFVWKATALFDRYKKTGHAADLDLALENYQLFSKVVELTINEFKEEDAIIALYRDYMISFEEAILFCSQAYDFTGEEKFLEEAFIFSEKTNALILRAALKEDKAKSYAGISEKVIQEEMKLKEDLLSKENTYQTIISTLPVDSILANNYLSDTLFHAKRALEKFTLNLEKQYPSYFKLKYAQKIPSVKEIQQTMLKEDDALIEYFLGDTSLFVFTITRNDFALERLPVDTLFLQEVKNFRKSTGDNLFIQNDPSLASLMYQQSAAKLYEKLFPAKSRRNLQNKFNLIIIPDGLLCHIPFDVLLVTNEALHSTNTHYLIEDHSIAYLYSASMLYETSKHQQGKTLYAGFAPTYDLQQLATADELKNFETFRGSPYSLTENTFEVMRAGDYLKGDVFIGDEANERDFKKTANNYSILHLAMHALINDRNPLSSTLIFTNTADGTEDGYLHTYEIYNMKLNADLAVLSACNTADGVLQSGEGIMSLSRAFMFAGVNNIVSTLWPANDATSSQLMESFFKNIKDGMPLAKALRDAKLAYLTTADPAHVIPYYWANFILVGNNDALAFQQGTSWLDYGLWMLFGLALLMVFLWYKKRH